MTLYGGFVRVIIRWIPVRIVCFHESPSCSLLVLGHLFLLMRAHFLMGLDVAIDTQQLDVRWIVSPRLHAVGTFNRVSTFDWLDVVAVNARGNESLALAPLAQASSPLPHYPLHLCPTWRV